MIGKVILGLAATGAAGLTLWRVAETVGRAQVEGWPPWLILWRHPLPDEGPPSKWTIEFGKYATIVYCFDKREGWMPIIKHKQLKKPKVLINEKSPPEVGRICAQVDWEYKKKLKKWVVSKVEYSSEPKIPSPSLHE